MKTVVVVGGGITGLTALYHLKKMSKEHESDIELILIEGKQQLGGKIVTVRDEEFIMEAGADSIVARHEGVMPLIEELNLQDELVYNETGTSYIFTNEKLHKIPQDTIFGIPMTVDSLNESTLVSEEGKRAALKDLDSKNDHFTKEDSIGDFLEAFLGKEMVEKQIAPVLSGVYSGDLYGLNMATTLPYLLDYKNEYGSIMKGLTENKTKFQGTSNKKFLSFEHGLSTIIDRLEEACSGAAILKGVKVNKLKKKNAQYELTLNDQSNIQADYVIFATPHDVTQKILDHEELEPEFNELKNSSLISIYLGFNIPDEELPADGTGFIVSNGGEVKCDACTWTSRKWKHTSQNQKLLVRLFYKSTNPDYDKIQLCNEAELISTALLDIRKSIGITGEPISVEVTKWTDLMPNYHLEHSQSVNSLENKLSTGWPGVKIAGASYYGVGIGACIQNGLKTADWIMDKLKDKA
ncbi:protoporphyrinogen oxidase (plasmid) [Cytobacillus spongiae]|uniref:protoporphyrinogen oxidase n=1 Tax=Cytobacillus spongiae TaxID=2901381 RepID=UPI001F45C002|nr:protoporphyrinogen oxidase [Cytobacillus spongiae]UII58253.1 protoporphyrinogen oxidase [Cytobacillus spongiae]